MEGNLKAYTYLGILDAFGLGVEKNPENAFAYMSKAAKDGDEYARVYLANFYRYGIGTTPNMAAASEIIGVVLGAHDGLIAFMRVQETLLSDSEALAAAGNLLRDFAKESDCLQKTKLDHEAYVDHLHDCPDAAANFMFSQGGSAHPTINDPEEIYPEMPFWKSWIRK